jgi:hypothetical protein
MKKSFKILVVASIALYMTACEKIENALFKPFESPLNFEVNIPVITNTTAEQNMGQTQVRYNLDSIIRKNTENVFGADVVGSMYINQIGVQLLDDNANSNLSNFDYIKLSVSNGSTPAVLGPYNIPSGVTSNTTFLVSNSPNIKPFFSGATVTFTMDGKANKATSQTLRARISATIRFEK